MSREICFKILPEYFDKIVSGHKTFEHRVDVKGLINGDYMMLWEINSLEKKQYTGGFLKVQVSDVYELPSDGFILSIHLLEYHRAVPTEAKK